MQAKGQLDWMRNYYWYIGKYTCDVNRQWNSSVNMALDEVKIILRTFFASSHCLDWSVPPNQQISREILRYTLAKIFAGGLFYGGGGGLADLTPKELFLVCDLVLVLCV